MTTVGQALALGLAARGVSVVFGIPGVHTIELYRGLAASGIRHVTPRHEGSAGFMADGYARISGKVGTAFVITGPGVTNILTPMGQARADSVPILVISGVNAAPTLGRGMGHLHEMPDQRAMVAQLALVSERIETAAGVAPALGRAFAALTGRRGGPVHLEVPLDVMPMPCAQLPAPAPPPGAPVARPDDLADDLAAAARLLLAARRPVILAGGGARWAEAALQALAERLDAPVVQTVNARGLMHGHALTVPASPSLEAVRALIGGADAVLAVGTEFGPTDYDMYGRGDLPAPPGMIRVDIDAAQLARHPHAVGLLADAGDALAGLLALVPAGSGSGSGSGSGGADRAAGARAAAWAEIGPAMRDQVAMVQAMQSALPHAIIVGDSTQPVYAGNLYYDHDRAGGWFNAATGFGALGYGPPAAIGAAIADPSARVVCLCGDGGLQFSLAELMSAKDEGVDVTFVIWNNHGYREIAQAMTAAGAPVLGCAPSPPLMEPLARACGLPFASVANEPEALRAALVAMADLAGPKLVEIRVA